MAHTTEEARFRGKRGDYVVVRYHQLVKDEYYVRTPSGQTRGSFGRNRAFQVARELAEKSRRS